MTERTETSMRSNKKAAHFFFCSFYQSLYNDRSRSEISYNEDTKREEQKTKTKLLELEAKVSKMAIKTTDTSFQHVIIKT